MSDPKGFRSVIFTTHGDSPLRGFYLEKIMFESYLLTGAVLVAAIGGIGDLRSARIPNWLTYSGLLTALILRSGLLGWQGFKSGVVAMLVSAALFYVLFVIGAMGGGDLKLMAAVSAWAGREHVFSVLIAAALAGGLLAIVYMLFARGLHKTLWNVVDLVRFRLTSGLLPHPVLNVRQSGTLRVPFGVAIAMGTLFCAGNAIWWR